MKADYVMLYSLLLSQKMHGSISALIDWINRSWPWNTRNLPLVKHCRKTGHLLPDNSHRRFLFRNFVSNRPQPPPISSYLSILAGCERGRQQFALYPPGDTDKNTQPNLEIPEEIPTHLWWWFRNVISLVAASSQRHMFKRDTPEISSLSRTDNSKSKSVNSRQDSHNGNTHTF